MGVAKVPGADDKHFCKPTHVAVAADGSFFVADGYCNSRVAAFDAAGRFLREWGSASPKGLDVPHSIVLDQCRQLLLVADRCAARRKPGARARPLRRLCRMKARRPGTPPSASA